MADEDDTGVSAEEAGDISRAASAGTKDAEAGEYDPDNKLGSDSDAQKDAYNKAHDKASD